YPKGIWLPECAYRPREFKNGYVRESIDYWLNNSGIKYFFIDSHGITDAELLEQKNKIGLNTNFGYSLETGVSVFGRNKITSSKVWDATVGYPGNGAYMEFHKKDHESGHYYWRITDKKKGNNEKELYNVEIAQKRVRLDANHFISVLESEMDKFQKDHSVEGLILSPYDFELYGHWWKEGIDWLKNIFELIYKHEGIKMITISDYISKYKERFSVIKMKESSWGKGGHFEVWKNPEHGWIWPYINNSMKQFEEVLSKILNPNQWEERILKQMARELLLMEGSDWPFLLYTKQAKEYANKRFHSHHQRFNKLLWAAKDFNDKNRISIEFLEEVESIDSCFQELNLDNFKQRTY
ncbi:MAG: DUF1957 domain-containing protein, partial [Candidatus Lokiarchaeota archaeon]|nr:DUF1957 domain-containing protein [Candidatus Lokiarchaeota archaeon]